MSVVQLPDARHEHWKYTRLTPLAQTPEQTEPCDMSGPDWAVELVETADCVFRFDGVTWQIPASLPKGVTVVESDVNIDVAGAESLLEMAASAPALSISIAKNQQAKLAIVTEAADGLRSQCKFSLSAETSAEVSLVDCSLSGERAVQNKVVNVDLAANARCRHLQITVGGNNSNTAAVYTNQQANIARDAAYGRWEFAFDGLLQRSSAAVNLADVNAFCQLFGVLMPFGKSHFDSHFWINHLAEHTNSNIAYRALADQRGRAVFDGLVHVARGAQKTDSGMQIKSLMLSPHAEIDAKPELEIFADDVKCAHGSTIGEIDPQALFYLRSRGIDKNTAKAMMTYAFAAEIIETVEGEQWKSILSAELRQRFDMLDGEA